MIDTDFLNGGGTSESGGGTIADNSITNTKLSQSPANTLKGNNTGSLANAQDLTVTQIKTLLEITGAYISQGTFDASTGSFPASTKNGWTYIISVAGVIDSIDLQVGDRIYSLVDNASTTTYAGNWFHDDNTGKVTSVNTKDGVVVLNQDDIGDGTTNKQYSQTEKTKLSNIADNATANDTDANLKARANHTGQQTASTISDFDAEVSNNTNVAQNTTNRHTHTNKILLDTYTQTEGNLSNAVSHSQATSGNPHSVTKVDVGLGNVDNTSDANKPVSTLQQTALNAKADISVDLDQFTNKNITGLLLKRVNTTTEGGEVIFQKPDTTDNIVFDVLKGGGNYYLRLFDSANGINFNISQRRIENIADPVANQDVATKKYVDDNGGAGTLVKSLTGLVPAMTGYTQAGFTVSASSEFNTTTFAAWRAFDGTTLQWAVLGSLTNFWIKIQLPSAKKVWKVELLGRPSNDVPRNYVIQGSNDDVNWYTIGGHQDILYGTFGIMEHTTDYSTAYLYYRVFSYWLSGANPGLQTFQLYEAT